MSDEKQTFSMGSKDCAIIIKEDMSSEMIIPKFADDEHVGWEEHQNLFITVAISSSMGEPDFREVITKKLDEMMTMNSKAEGGSGDCTPTDGGIDGCTGGCCGCGSTVEGEVKD
jgi:hypothetical protein